MPKKKKPKTEAEKQAADEKRKLKESRRESILLQQGKMEALIREAKEREEKEKAEYDSEMLEKKKYEDIQKEEEKKKIEESKKRQAELMNKMKTKNNLTLGTDLSPGLEKQPLATAQNKDTL